MDYSTKYCLMCYQADELTEIFKTQPQPKIVMKRLNERTFMMSDKQRLGSDYVWLPTEEQLEKLTEAFSDTDYFTFIKQPYHPEETELPFNLFHSFEQYRLTFFMKKMYNKFWLNSQWV